MKHIICFLLVFFISFNQGRSDGTNKCNCDCTRKPNIIYIMADDMGWNDIYSHGNNDVCTPNIDALMMLGIRLPRFYVHQMCSPSRGALMTGRWGHRTGLNCLVIGGTQSRCLPLNQTTLAEYLRECGYDTGLVGKWHLGHCSKSCWPKQRGFNYYYGFLLGRSDYFDGTYKEVGMDNMESYHGFDIREGNDLCYNHTGQYLTDVFTEKAIKFIKNRDCSKPFYLQLSHLANHASNDYWPLRAKDCDIDKFKCVDSDSRRNITAMTYALDQSVGAIMKALNETGLLNCTIVIFSSDNGGSRSPLEYLNTTNCPLRSEKSTVYEGGTRVPGGIWYPCFQKCVQSKDFPGYFHVADWLPTLLSAAQCNCSRFNKGEIDGIDMWKAIGTGSPSSRDEIVNIDPCIGIASVTKGSWKLVCNGSNNMVRQNSMAGICNRYSTNCRGVCNETTVVNSPTAKILSQALGTAFCEQDVTAKRNGYKIKCHTKMKQEQNCMGCSCLFNIKLDPCENVNLLNPLDNVLGVTDMKKYISKAEELKAILEREQARSMPTFSIKGNPKANPKFWNCAWPNWCDHYNIPINTQIE